MTERHITCRSVIGPGAVAVGLVALALLAAWIIVVLSTVANAADSPNAATIKSLLTKPQSWTLYLEYTDSATPTERASKQTWQYFERDGKLMARQLGLAFGGCDLEISLRDDGYSFHWCPPYNGEPSLTFDAKDAKYPFKSHNPRKLWLFANE